MITVYGSPQTRSTRITWLLQELGQDYQFKRIDFTKGDHRSVDFLAVNPGGKIPAVDVDGLLITESGAIVTYLAERYSPGVMIPLAASPERAHYLQWSYFALCELEQPLWTIAKHKFALPEAQRVSAVTATATWEFQKALALLSQGLGTKDYILGNHFTGADILLAHTLIWAEAFQQPIEQQNLQDYLQRCQQRSALKLALEKELA